MSATPPEDRFPPDLLSRPKEQRLLYFHRKTITHPRLADKLDEILNAIRSPLDPPIIHLIGPTGVGKSTLIDGVQREILNSYVAVMAADPGIMPFVGMQAIAPETGTFSWREFYTRALLALRDPFLCDEEGHPLPRPGNVVASELRRMFEQAVHHRHLIALCVDEAQHMSQMATNRRLRDHVEVLKSLLSSIKIPLLLAGTYDLRFIMDLSAQVARRTIDVHFSRYRADVHGDVVGFMRTLFTFARHLPLQGETDLLARWEWMYEHCLGCIGILKPWLDRALASALDADRATLDEERDLERTAIPVRKLAVMAEDIKLGEQRLADTQEQRRKVREILGLLPPAPAAAGSQAKSGMRSRKHRVGQSRPRRRPVGDPTRAA